MHEGQQVQSSRLGDQRIMDAPNRIAPPSPQPLPVHAAQANLDDQLRTLHDLIESLYSRLQPVLSMPAEKTAQGVGQIKPVDNTVAQKIDTSARSVREAVERLIDIRERLEI